MGLVKLYFLVTKSMVQDFSWKSHTYKACQWIPYFMEQDGTFFVYWSPPFDPVINQMHPVRILASRFYNPANIIKLIVFLDFIHRLVSQEQTKLRN
jgi:hypothetical protein